MIPHDQHLQIGSLLFEGLDQIDLTGPFEVLSRIPNSTYRLYGRSQTRQFATSRGLRFSPDASIGDAPQLDVLHVPGGRGQEALDGRCGGARLAARSGAGMRGSSRSAPARCSSARRVC